jgi:hypothetical protein
MSAMKLNIRIGAPRCSSPFWSSTRPSSMLLPAEVYGCDVDGIPLRLNRRARWGAIAEAPRFHATFLRMAQDREPGGRFYPPNETLMARAVGRAYAASAAGSY